MAGGESPCLSKMSLRKKSVSVAPDGVKDDDVSNQVAAAWQLRAAIVPRSKVHGRDQVLPPYVDDFWMYESKDDQSTTGLAFISWVMSRNPSISFGV